MPTRGPVGQDSRAIPDRQVLYEFPQECLAAGKLGHNFQRQRDQSIVPESLQTRLATEKPFVFHASWFPGTLVDRSGLKNAKSPDFTSD